MQHFLQFFGETSVPESVGVVGTCGEQKIEQRWYRLYLVVHIYGLKLNILVYLRQLFLLYIVPRSIHRQQANKPARLLITFHHHVHGNITPIVERVWYTIGKYQYTSCRHWLRNKIQV